MKKILFLTHICLLIGIISSSIYAEKLGSPLSIGLGYPYVSLKYKALEAKAAAEEGVNVYGGRLYLNLKSKNEVKFFTGIEYDLINFDTEDIKGNGTVFLPFIGGEYFVSNKLSLSLDFGPGYIKLKDAEYSNVSVVGWEWIVNLGIWIYF